MNENLIENKDSYSQDPESLKNSKIQKINNTNENEENEKNDDDNDDDDIENLGNNDILNKNMNNNSKNKIIINKDISQNDDNDNENDNDNDEENIENLNAQEDRKIRLLTIIVSSFCIFTIMLTILFSNHGKKFLTFKSDEKERLFINKYIMYGYLLFFIISNIIIIIFLSYNNKNKNLRKILYQNLRYYFILTQGFFGFLFFIEVYWKQGDWTLIFSISVSMSVTILLAFYYEEIKAKKNMTKETLISIFIYISSIFAFVSYITFFNSSCILINSLTKIHEQINTDKDNVYLPSIRIGTTLFQTILGIILLTYFKDLFFSLFSIYIELGILIEYPSDKKNEKIWLAVFIFLLFLSSFFSLYRYGKLTLGIEKRKNN